eukprot:11185017-Lingulodinium_polyedra.AAC.1
MRRPAYGGRRLKCAKCEMRCAAAAGCVSVRMSEQVSRESCTEMRSEMHSSAAAPQFSRFVHSVRRIATCATPQ